MTNAREPHLWLLNCFAHELMYYFCLFAEGHELFRAHITTLAPESVDIRHKCSFAVPTGCASGNSTQSTSSQLSDAKVYQTTLVISIQMLSIHDQYNFDFQ